jgi:hypothetical protein
LKRYVEEGRDEYAAILDIIYWGADDNPAWKWGVWSMRIELVKAARWPQYCIMFTGDIEALSKIKTEKVSIWH